MSDTPKFNPNNIVKRAYLKDVNSSNLSEPSTDGEVPKYDASKIVKRGYAPREAFQEEGFAPEKYVSDGGYEDVESTLDFVQNKMPGLRDMRDDEKDILRDIMRNPNATKEDISDAITTFKGVNPEQVYNQRARALTKEYYMDVDDKGIYKPVPIGEYKPLPAGKNIASVWGTGGADTQDDSWYTDLAKKAFNIIPSAMEGVTDFVAAASSDLRKIGTKIEGKEYEKTDATMASEEAGKFFQQFKFPTSEEYNQQIYDAEGVKNFEDLISKDRVNLSLKNVYGTVSSLAGSVGEMLLTGGAAAEGALAAKTAMASKVKGIPTTLTKAQKYASVYTGSFITNLGEAMDAAKKAGISDEDAGSWAMAVTIPIAFTDAGLGIGGKILSNKLANEGKKELFENLADRVVKDELGNITEEFLKKASSEAVKAYNPIAKSVSRLKLGLKDVLEQGSEEALQSFISSAGEQLYDKLSDADKAKFGTDAFSAESFGKYISEGVAGLIGSGPLAVKTAKAKQQELYKAQSNSAYETVMQGEDAVKAFKTDITNAFQENKISKEDYDNAILKVDAYDSYEKTTKDLTLDNDNKKKLFELSLQKENLKAAIKDAESKDTEGHSRLDKMNPAELGLHNAKVKQAKALQDEIDLIVTKSEVLQQPEVAEKVVEKVVKAEEKATEGAKEKEGVSSEIGAILGRQYKVKTPVGGEVAVPGKAAYEVPKKVLEEKRKMKDFSTEEWKIANATVKQAKFADALEEVPEKTVEGTLQQDNRYQDKKTGLWVQTYNLTLPNGKAAQFASSMVRFPEESAIGGFRGNTYEENLTNKKSPIGQKLGATVRTLKDSGRKVIFIWNADEGPKYGKHIGMVREDPEGKSVYGAADLDEMADLRMINMGQNPNAPAPGIFTPKEPTKGGSPKVVVPVKNKEVRDKLKGLGYSKTEIQAMEPQEANDIVKEKREKSKVKKQPLEEVEIKDKKAATKVEKKIADYREQEQVELKREIPNIDKYKVDGKVDENLIKDSEDLKKYKKIWEAYDKKISPLLGKEPATTPTDLEALKQTPADIERISKETEAKIKRKDLFIGVGDFSSELGGSDMAAVPVSHKEINGIEFVEYAHPKTGSIDVIVTGKSENDFVGFYRLYENGKPTNKWSSKFENQSRNKEDFKTMISGIQEMLPQGHEYTEKTSISTDGLRIWNQQLDRGYELQYDENGKLKTNLVAINGDAIVNDLGIDVNKGEFENIKVKSKEEFEKVKKALLPYLQKFGLNENNIKWISGNIEITPTNEKAFGVTGTVKIDLPILKSTKQVTEKTKPAKEKGKVVVKREGIGTENYKNNKNQFTGRSTSKVIPNGEKIKGTYKLVEANDVLASHNEKNFAQTDNFPKREDGSTLNDRDYQKDKNAQNEVIRIANKFDDRAISNIPTVTQDGIVVDGNNRTMSRKLAAENKTDLGYKEALKEKLDMYGFTEKQFNSLKNPFLIFEMEQDVDYTTELFSKFNVAEKKEKSPIDKAVEISKTIDERGKRLISDLYANVSTPSEVTSNPVKVRQVIKLLQNLGILQPNEIPRYFDITKSTTTRDGVSFLESIVLGSSLTESAIRSLDNEGMGKVKTQLLSSIAQLTKNSSLDENSLKNEISKVVDLINTLKGLDLTLDEYISQPDIFGEKQPISVNDYAIAVAVSQPGFKKWLADYNDRVGQMDMFKGDVVTKKDILEETIQLKTGKTAESIRGIERLQKAKVKPATLNKFEKSVDLFYKTKDADGASKKRSLAAERREFLEKNPTVKYIDDNMKYIYKQLEDQNIIERKGECP